MMRSLFSGVSGLKSHQTRMDVIGNNIANINTVGFKSSRATFADLLSQTQAGAASPTDSKGGTNPKQIGLGVSVSSIDLIFTDGSTQATGKNSDLALSGNGLFVVSDGNSNYYTRNGAFEYDANGYYVLPGSGYKVQGWNAVNGSLNTNSLPTDIIVPAGKTMPAVATTQLKLSGNLNSRASLISSINGTESDLTEVDVKKNTTVNLKDGTSASAPNVGTYTIGHSMPISTTFAVYDSLGTEHQIPMLIERCPEEDITEVYSNTSTSSEEENDEEGGTTSTGNRDKKVCWKMYLAYDKNTDYTYTDATGTYTSTPSATNIKLDDGTLVFMTDPIYIYFNSIDGSYSHVVQEKGTAADTLSDLRHRTGGTLSSSEEGGGSDEEGGTAAVPTYSGGNPDSLAATAVDGSSSEEEGSSDDESETTTSTTKGGHARDGAANPNAAKSRGTNSTTLADDTDTGTAMLVLRYTQTYSTATVQGAIDQKIDYYNSTTGQLEDTRVTFIFDDPKSPLTQYAESTSSAKGALRPVGDGHRYGILTGVEADSSGIITGTYSNGERQFEAQIAVAQFINPAGLTKVGGSIYTESNNSGTASIATAEALNTLVYANSLEMSNVDLANEFSEMIITQRGFQANSKIINVGDEMLETLVNMKR